MENIRKNNKLTDLFCRLALIPSPSLREDKVIDEILKIFEENNIQAFKDEFGNVRAQVPATDPSKKSVLLSAHTDVVGDDSPVNLKLNGSFIETDKSRTLGADDKAGVAAAILLAIEISQDKSLKHGGLEIIFTRDEEQNMSGIRHVNMSEIKSEYVLVLDADKLAQVQFAGAGYTKVSVCVTALKGGHSGIDIDDPSRVNAVKLIAELVNAIPQGVYKKDDSGVITSINAGVVVGGGISSPIDLIKNSDVKSKDYCDFISEHAVTNIINTEARAAYSLRSSSREFEQNLISEIQDIVADFNKKYEGLAVASLEISEHLPPFEKSDDETLIDTAEIAAKNLGLVPDISSFHAGAETHIYANAKNMYGVTLKPVLLGLADVYNMHSPDEKIDYLSHIKGYEFLKEFFKEFNK